MPKKLLSLLLAVVFAASLFTACAAPVEEVPISTTDVPEITPTPTVAPTTTPEPTPTPTPVPTPEPTPIGDPYKCRVNDMNLRSSPDKSSDSNVVGKLGYEDPLYLLEYGEEFSKVRLESGEIVYCYSDFIVPYDTVLYAYLPAETGQKIDIPTGEYVFDSEGNPVMVKNELIDLRLYLPDAEYELLFATERNVIGEPLYPRAIPLLQKDTAKKLQKAFEIFKEDGYTLKIYDAYRPVSVQRRLFEVVKNPHWIANPDTTASNHNRGCAVDIALLDADGKELEFPTPMHTFTEESARTCKTWSEEATQNVDYMTKVMKECGFNSITSEWWHFADSKKSRYMTTDIDLGKLTMLPKQEDNEA